MPAAGHQDEQDLLRWRRPSRRWRRRRRRQRDLLGSRWWCSSGWRSGIRDDPLRRTSTLQRSPSTGRHRVRRDGRAPVRMRCLGSTPRAAGTAAARTRGGDSVHVVVVGCGRVGSRSPAASSRRGHTVAVIDSGPRRSAACGERLHRPDDRRHRLRPRPAARRPASSRPAPLAAVTNGDNSNILIARVARETFGIERVVARIYDPRRAAIYQRLGIPTVATVAWTTERVLRRILPDEAGGRVGRPERQGVARRAGRSRRRGRAPAVRARGAGPASRVVAVGRLGVAQIPTPDLVAQEGDVAVPRGRRRRASPTSTRRLAPGRPREGTDAGRHRRRRQRRHVHRRAARTRPATRC